MLNILSTRSYFDITYNNSKQLIKSNKTSNLKVLEIEAKINIKSSGLSKFLTESSWCIKNEKSSETF